MENPDGNKKYKSFLILRMSSAGDVVHGMPVAVALKKQYPDCKIGWLIEDRFAALLDNFKSVDKLHILPRRAWKNSSFFNKLGEIRKLVAQIKNENYDVAIDMQGLNKSSIAGFLCNIPKRVGFAKGGGGREFSTLFNTETVLPQKVHVVERNLELLKGFGVSDCEADFGLSVAKTDVIDDFLNNAGLEEKPFMVLNPGAGWDAKKWPLERFGFVVEKVVKETSFPVIISWGGENERKMAETIIEMSGKNAIIAPPTNLMELWDLLSRSTFYLGCDTGPTHMAAASGTDTLALFGPTAAERNGPYGSGRCEYIHGKCGQYPLCWKKRYRAGCTCMDLIEADSVGEKCISFINDLRK